MSDKDISPADQARRLLRASERAYLATHRRKDAESADWPYAALVLIATDHDASPILLISGLAEHTKDIAEDDRVSLLIDGTAGLDDPLTGPRVTILGRARRSDDPRHRARYVARHPSAEMYAGFRDFGFYRISVDRAHLVAGFGRIHWIAGTDLLADAADAGQLIEAEREIIEHMNGDHADAVALYAERLLQLPPGNSARKWTITGVDPEGCDLRLGGPGGVSGGESGSESGGVSGRVQTARLDFQRRVATPEQVRAELVKLAKKTRAAGPA